MARQKAFLKYKGMTIYRALKGNAEGTLWYTQIQNHQVEEEGNGCFDIRLLPRKYRRGLDIEPDFSGARAPPSAGYYYDGDAFKRILDLQGDAHREVLRRAIDDNYDLEAAARRSYGQFFRRLRQWLLIKLGRSHT
jgi:hypothetical protein